MAFGPCKSTPDGLRSQCRECHNQSNRESSKRTYKRKAAYARRYYAENKERLSAKTAKWHLANKARRNSDAMALYADVRVREPERHIWYGAKARARQYGLEFDIRVEDIVIPDVCPVLGIPIVMRPYSGKKGPKQDSPSIDRRDPSRGYVRGNIRIVSHRANTLLNNATADELERVLAFRRKDAEST